MRNFFNTDNAFWRAMAKTFDMVVLNIIWLIFSLPVITIGPATAALNYAMLKVVDGDDYELWKSFWKSFKQNLKQGILIGLLFTVMGVVMYIATVYYVLVPGKLDNIFQIFQIFVDLVYLLVCSWVFGVLARYNNKIGIIMGAAFTLSIQHFGYSVLMIVTEVSILFIVLLYAPILGLWGMGLIAFINCICYRSAFGKIKKLEILFPEKEGIGK